MNQPFNPTPPGAAVLLHTQRNNQQLQIVFDQPHKSVNTLSPQALDELDAILNMIEADPSIQSVIFSSAKPAAFIAGVDLFAIAQMTDDTLWHLLEQGQQLFDRIQKLSATTVAAINGTCLGGGMELALACDHRVAADLGAINLGLPETKLGIVPAWGGTTRLTTLLGPVAALPLLLAGSTMPPRQALRQGLIDQVVRPEALPAAAIRLAGQAPPARRLSRTARLTSAAPMRALLLKIARRKTKAQTHGHYPAADAIFNIVSQTTRHGHSAGLAAERQAVMSLRKTACGQNLMRLFFLRHTVKHKLPKQTPADPVAIGHAAVIGGGMMGADIACALVKAGIHVRLIEINTNAAATARHRIQKRLQADQRAKRLSPLEAKQALDRVSPTDQYTGLGLADLVIEAVAESPKIKQQVFAKLDALTRPDAILATNTSSLNITQLARGTRNPCRVIGLHFFNPVAKMPLVEVIRTDHSNDTALATAAALALRLGKTPILVHDAPGFVVNRILIPYLAQAMSMAHQGACIQSIDTQMKQWGMPIGPFELLDQVGLDVAANILDSLGGRLPGNLQLPQAIRDTIGRGDLGRKTGQGFYTYNKKRRPILNVRLASELGAALPPTRHHESATPWRLLIPMINQAADLLDQGIIDEPDTLDLATVLGLGLAPFRGGLAQFAHDTGLAEIVRVADAQAATHGQHLAPNAALRRAATAGSLSALTPKLTNLSRPQASEIKRQKSEIKNP